MWRLIKNKTTLAVASVFGAALLLGGQLVFASTTIQANICRTSYIMPTISEPAQALETKDVSITVKGTGEPNMPVAILDNGADVGSGTAAGDGTFALQVPLAVGDNTLIARQTDGCTAQDSGAVNIRRIVVSSSGQPPASTSPENEPSAENGKNNILPSSGSEMSLGSALPSSNPQSNGQNGHGNGIYILQPHDGAHFNEKYIWVRGKAQPGSKVMILVNGKEVAHLVADDKGTFAVMITLRPGDNILQAIAEKDGQSVASRQITVHFVESLTTENPVQWGKILEMVALFVILIAIIIFFWRRHRRDKESDV